MFKGASSSDGLLVLLDQRRQTRQRMLELKRHHHRLGSRSKDQRKTRRREPVDFNHPAELSEPQVVGVGGLRFAFRQQAGRGGSRYGVGEDGVLAFTDFGIESLIELIKMYKDDPTLLKRYDPQ
jgi:hypothetical protein